MDRVSTIIPGSSILNCVWDFGRTGRGTPAPIAPPQRLVVVGFYRYVRNPMYMGFATGWIGLWIIFGHANPAAIAAAVSIALGIHLFILAERQGLGKSRDERSIRFIRSR